MDEEEAMRLEALGYRAIPRGGGVWIAVRAEEDGRFVVLSGGLHCVYGSASAFWDGDGPIESCSRKARRTQPPGSPSP